MSEPAAELDEDLVAQEEAEEAAAWVDESDAPEEVAPEEDLDEVAREEAEEAAAWAAQEAQRLSEIHAAAKKLATRPASMVHAVLRSRLGAYTATEMHRVGEVADLLVATREDTSDVLGVCLLKVARSGHDGDLLDNEARVLGELQTKTDERSRFFLKYLPTLLDSFDVESRRVNVLDMAAEYVSLAEIRDAYPAGIDTRDAAWMLRRTFEVLGWVHSQGYVHGAVLPEHVLVHPTNHGAKLVGWSYAVRNGSAMSAVSGLRKDMYPEAILRRSQATPSLDVAMAAETASILLRDTDGHLRTDVPHGLLEFLTRCKLRLVSDGWVAYREYDAILKQLYGERRYRKFAMPV